MKTTSGRLSAGVILALVLVCGAGMAADGQFMGSSRDTSSGVTTSVYKNADGTRDVVRTDANGRELSRETHGNEPVTKAKPNTDPVGGSSTNPDNGITTQVILNANGSRTIIITQNGKELHRETLNPPEMLSNDGYQIQNAPPSNLRVVTVQPTPVYVERREVIQERTPRILIGLGFGFGSRHCETRSGNSYEPRRCR